MTRLRQIVRDEPVTAALFALATVAALLPVWIGRYLPLLDWPNHLAEVFIWRHLHDPQWNFATYYKLRLVPEPYWVAYLFIHAFATVFSVETAQKLFLSLVLVAQPIAFGCWARRMGRDPRLALFTLPLAWNVNLAEGFLSFCAGLPLLFFALAALDRFTERPTAKWGALAALLGISLYFTHVLPWALFMAAGGVTALAAGRGWRRIVGPLPTVIAAVTGFLCARVSADPSTPHGPRAFDGVFSDVGGNLSIIPAWLMSVAPCGVDEVCAFALGLLWVLLVAGGRGDDGEPLATPRAFRVEMAAVVVLAAFLLLPRSLTRPFYWYAVNRRLAVILALVAIGFVRGRITGARRWLLWAAGAVALVHPIDLAGHFHRFNRRARDFDAVMAPVPVGKQVLPLMLQLGDPEVIVNCFNQWGSYVQMRVGGYNQFTFPMGRGGLPAFPIGYARQLAAPPWDHPELFDYRRYGADWDYFLVHGPARADPFAGAHDHVALVAKAGEWELWRNLERK